MTMANCHSTIRNPDQMDMQGGKHAGTSPTAVGCGPQRLHYSVSNLVEKMHRLQNLCWHVVLLWKASIYLVRWESPPVTMSFWITSLLFCYFMDSTVILVYSITVLLFLSGVGALANLNRQEIQKQRPSSTSAHPGTAASQPRSDEHPSVLVDLDQQQKHGREILAEYRQLMLLTQDWLGSCCQILESINAILCWQDPLLSPGFYGGCFASILILHFLPLRWFAMATISTILCLNPSFKVLLLQAYQAISINFNTVVINNNNNKAEMSDKEPIDVNPVLPVTKDPKEKAPGEDTAKPRPPPNIEHRPLHLCHKSKSLDEAGPKVVVTSRDRSSTAPELPSFKLNVIIGSDDVCFTCGIASLSALKRRRYCRSCGNQFCHRCCSRKLPRSVFGATSPAAHMEKEFVCNSCFCNMTADEVRPPGSGTSGTTIEEC